MSEFFGRKPFDKDTFPLPLTDSSQIFEQAGKRNAAEVMQLIKNVQTILQQENLCGKGNLAETIPSTWDSSNGDKYFVDGKIAYLPLKGTAIFVGDTHADSISTEKIVRQTGFIETIENGGGKEKTYLVFLGDYIDRGKNNMRNLEIVLDLKARYPNNVVLLMGNHEEGRWFPQNFNESILKHFESQDDQRKVALTYKTLFGQLPVVLVTANGIVAVHGGVPIGEVRNLQELRNNEELFEQIRANDPDSYLSSFVLSDRGIGYKFGKRIFDQFMRNIGGTVMVRSHEYPREGYKLLFDDRLVTIFSNGGTSDESQYRDKVHPKYMIVSLKEPVSSINLKNIFIVFNET